MNQEKRKFIKVIKSRRRHERYLITKRQGKPRKRNKTTKSVLLKLSLWQRIKNWVMKLFK